MRAFVVTQYKQPLREAEVAEPAVGERDVLVQVQAAGLNQLDEKIRLGEFKQILPYKLQLILGNDVAGTVLQVGANVRGFKPGDEVYARPDKDRIGTFAERIAVAEEDLALKPASASMEEAGSLPLVALTAWQALVERGNVRPGQNVLIHAGAGGVGSYRYSARQAPRRDRCHHREQRQRRLRAGPRRGHRDRLPQPGL
jgi:NADPH:quinone reductase-like Zn-dependent oxidoreductase